MVFPLSVPQGAQGSPAHTGMGSWAGRHPLPWLGAQGLWGVAQLWDLSACSRLLPHVEMRRAPSRPILLGSVSAAAGSEEGWLAWGGGRGGLPAALSSSAHPHPRNKLERGKLTEIEKKRYTAAGGGGGTQERKKGRRRERQRKRRREMGTRGRRPVGAAQVGGQGAERE